MGVKLGSFIELSNFKTSYTNTLVTIFSNKGVQNTYAALYASQCLRLLQMRYANVETFYSSTTSLNVTQCISYLTDVLRANILPEYMINTNFKFKKSDTITKTGTESDAGEFANDPTTNDEFRSYPFDTTASDVQSKTRSIVNGAESGTNSNVKTYDTEDLHEIIDGDYDAITKYETMVNDFIDKYLRYSLDTIRVNHTLVNPLSDDSTLLELEF